LWFFCYSDLQTEWATDLAESILGLGTSILDILNGGSIIDFSHLAINTRTGLIGFVSSAGISLQWAKNFVDGISSNSFSTLAGMSMVGLALNNVIINYREEESASSHVILDS